MKFIVIILAAFGLFIILDYVGGPHLYLRGDPNLQPPPGYKVQGLFTGTLYPRF